MLLLAAMLVLVQVLGMMHAVLHDHARVSGSHSSAALADQSGQTSWVKALFDGHDSQADCDDFDHMTHMDQACAESMPLEAGPCASVEVAMHSGWHIARQATGFLARGPPLRV